MVKVLDLDKIPKRYIKFNDKRYQFNDLSFDEDAESTLLLKEIAKETKIDDMVDKIHRFVQLHIDIPDDILENINVDHFALIVEYMERLPFYEKGWTDKEIDLVNKANALHEAQHVLSMVDE